MTVAFSGHELAISYDCRTPGCPNSARAKTGRHAYCDLCRARHGTAQPDGTPIVEPSPRPATTPGMHPCKTPNCPNETTAATGRNSYCLDCRVRRGTSAPDGRPLRTGHSAAPPDSFEAHAVAIVEAAKGVDVAIAKYRQARPRLEAAVAVWRSALQEAASFHVRSTVAAQSSNGNGAGAQDGH